MSRGDSVRRAIALTVVPLLALSTACSSDEGESNDSPAAEIKVEGDFGTDPKVDVEDLKVEDISSAVDIEGDGPAYDKERQALVDFSVFNGTTGDPAYSTFTTGQKLIVSGNNPGPIKGLVDALDGEKRGARVVLVGKVPDVVTGGSAPEIGLKEEDTIVVVADLLSVEPGDDLTQPEGTMAKAEAQLPTPRLTGDDVTGLVWAGVKQRPTTTRVQTLIEGDGPEIESGRLVTVNYYGSMFLGAKPFDESFTNTPVTFAVGVGSLIPAWDKGLVGVKEGSRIVLAAPAREAYGVNPPPKSGLPVGANLYFVIDVLNVDGDE